LTFCLVFLLQYGQNLLTVFGIFMIVDVNISLKSFLICYRTENFISFKVSPSL